MNNVAPAREAAYVLMSKSNLERMKKNTFTHRKLIDGGDWEYLSNVFGTSGPNGKHFCNHCYVTLGDMAKGKPHARHIFKPRYLGSAGNYELRSVSCMHADHRTFIDSKASRDQLCNFNNCEHGPLVSAEANVEDIHSCMPLHISLGLGEHFLNLIEEEARTLDKEVNSAKGIHAAEVETALDRQKSLTEQQKQLCEKLHVELETHLAALVMEMDQLKGDHSSCFTRLNGRLPSTSNARKARKEIKELWVKAKDIEQ